MQEKQACLLNIPTGIFEICRSALEAKTAGGKVNSQFRQHVLMLCDRYVFCQTPWCHT